MIGHGMLRLLGISLAMACAPGTDGGVEVKDASVRIAPAGATSAAAYATLHNRTRTADTLLGISSDAGELSLHDHATEAGLATMRPIGAVVLPAGATVRLAPGGLHAMLGTAGSAVAAGRVIRLTFRFSNAPAVSIEVPVTTVTGEE